MPKLNWSADSGQIFHFLFFLMIYNYKLVKAFPQSICREFISPVGYLFLNLNLNLLENCNVIILEYCN